MASIIVSHGPCQDVTHRQWRRTPAWSRQCYLLISSKSVSSCKVPLWAGMVLGCPTHTPATYPVLTVRANQSATISPPHLTLLECQSMIRTLMGINFKHYDFWYVYPSAILHGYDYFRKIIIFISMDFYSPARVHNSLKCYYIFQQL